jgi:hypothetical protein
MKELDSRTFHTRLNIFKNHPVELVSKACSKAKACSEASGHALIELKNTLKLRLAMDL